MSGPDDGPPTRPGVIRTAVPADAPALVDLRVLMFEAMGTDPQEVVDPAWRMAAQQWFAERTTADDVRVVVAEVDGAVVAGAVGEVTAVIPGPSAPNGSVGLISNVATLHGHRGHGYAAACTDDLLQWFAESTGVSRVDLFATDEGARIYAPRGFVRSDFPAMRLRVARD